LTHRFVQGIDYGPRRGTLGFAIHMAEGGDGTLPYLARRSGETDLAWRSRIRGVSANFVILSTGEVVQMVGWDRASGSMNPSDRGATTGFYQTSVLRAVLGSHYGDPNAYSLSVEVTGYRAAGPNRAQVNALVALVAESRDRFPGMVGAYGHADQTSTKGCPGTAPLMLEAWSRIGHGKFDPQEDIVKVYSSPGSVSAVWPAGTAIHADPTGASTGATTVTRRYLVVGQDKPTGPTRYLVDGGAGNPSGLMAWLPAAGMGGTRDETFNAGVAAAAQRAAGTNRED